MGKPGRPSAWKRELDTEWCPDVDPVLDDPGGGWLGVDVGFIFPAVDSDGQIYRWAKGRVRGQYAPAGPVTVRKASGVTYQMEAYSHGQLADVEARAELRESGLRSFEIAKQIVLKAQRSDRGVVLEDWEDFKRHRKSWIRVYTQVVKVCEEMQVPLRTVERAYTSQICPMCGHLSKGNRVSRDRFKCIDCGFTGQADHVAAMNIQGRADEGHQVVAALTCLNQACSKAPWKKGLCCSCYFYKRRYYRLPNAARLERLQVARNRREFVRTLEEVGRPPIGGDPQEDLIEKISHRQAERRAAERRLQSVDLQGRTE